MYKFNINNHIYIQISKLGWKYLKDTVGNEYIKHCIKNKKVVIDGKKWYRLQCHQVFNLLPINSSTNRLLFNTNILFDKGDLEDIS